MNSVFAPGMSRTTYPFDWWWKAETDPVLFCFPHALREGGSRTVEGRKVGRPTEKLLTWWPRTEGRAVAAQALWLLSPPSRPSLKKKISCHWLGSIIWANTWCCFTLIVALHVCKESCLIVFEAVFLCFSYKSTLIICLELSGGTLNLWKQQSGGELNVTEEWGKVNPAIMW